MVSALSSLLELQTFLLPARQRQRSDRRFQDLPLITGILPETIGGNSFRYLEGKRKCLLFRIFLVFASFLPNVEAVPESVRTVAKH